MLDIISLNPYRILGVYANSSVKEQVANKGKINAFLKVNKQASFPIDLAALLGPLQRTPEMVADADSRLAIERDKVRYAQFWFFTGTPFDIVTANYLSAGDINGAMAQWQKKESMATLQNLSIGYLIKGDYASATTCLSRLYTNYASEFASVLGVSETVTGETLVESYIKTIVETEPSVKISTLANATCSPMWNQTAKATLVSPLIKKINDALDACKQTKEKNINERLNAGRQLKSQTEKLLKELSGLVGGNDMQYVNIADKVANEMLQCGIDYYNGADTAFAALDCQDLIAAAEKLACGTMVKDRIKDNKSTLDGIVRGLPPKQVDQEDQQLRNALNKFCNQPDFICHSETLLNETEPVLKAIKQKLGATHPYYVERCSTIANNALHNLIEEINTKQKQVNDANGTSSYDVKLDSYKRALNNAKKCMDRILKLDVSDDVRKRLNDNNKTLSNLIENVKPTKSDEDGCLKGCFKAILTYVAYFIGVLIISGLVSLCS